MNKAEQFINDCTKTCSNELSDILFEAWITPEQALRAVEIEKEELLEKACKFFAPYIIDNSGGYDREYVLNEFRKTMEE